MSSVDNKFPGDWKEVNLVDNLESLIDYRGKTPKKSESGILTLSAKSVKMGYIDYNQAYYISIQEYKKFMVRGFPKKGDILMTTEAPLGCIAKLDRDDVGIAQRLLTLRGKENILDNNYLMYYLTSRKGQHELNSRASGSTVQGIKRSEFLNVNILLPKFKEQKAIAKVLTAFDDKIENLQAQNKTLEQTAQTIFKEWFGKYQIGDVLPEGWRVGKLGDELETVLGGTPSKKNDEYWENGTIPWINSGAVNNFRIAKESLMITEKGLKKSAAKLVPKGTVVIAITGATLGQYSRTEIECCFNQSVVGIKENKSLRSSYIYYWVASNIHIMIKKASGGAHQHINKENVNQTMIVIPSKVILEKFYKVTDPILEKISVNVFHIQTLTKTRDTLLPKLMSGAIRVNGFKSRKDSMEV